MDKLTETDVNNLKSIAAQAYGSGWGEKSNGGNGFIGLAKNMHGEIRVFKCLTHRRERTTFNRLPNDAEKVKLFQEASKELQKELQHLATKVDIKIPLYEFSGKELLTRKVVASIITKIVKADSRKADDFWREIKPQGTITDTMISIRQKNTSEFKGFANLKSNDNDDLLSGDTIKITDIRDCVRRKIIGKKFFEAINTAVNNFDNVYPLNIDSNLKTVSDKLGFAEILCNTNENRAFGTATLAERKEYNPLGHNRYITSFASALQKVFNDNNANLEITNKKFQQRIDLAIEQTLITTLVLDVGSKLMPDIVSRFNECKIVDKVYSLLTADRETDDRKESIAEIITTALQDQLSFIAEEINKEINDQKNKDAQNQNKNKVVQNQKMADPDQLRNELDTIKKYQNDYRSCYMSRRDEIRGLLFKKQEATTHQQEKFNVEKLRDDPYFEEENDRRKIEKIISEIKKKEKEMEEKQKRIKSH